MQNSKKIKEILIDLAADDKLPLDMHELDESVFSEFNEVPKKDPYVRLDFEGKQFVAKLDDEGVALDIWDGDESVASTWKLYSEMEESEEDADIEKPLVTFEKQCFEVHVHDGNNGYSVFFEASLANKEWDDIIAEAVDQKRMPADDMKYVDCAQEISREEYNKATGKEGK